MSNSSWNPASNPVHNLLARVDILGVALQRFHKRSYDLPSSLDVRGMLCDLKENWQEAALLTWDRRDLNPAGSFRILERKIIAEFPNIDQDALHELIVLGGQIAIMFPTPYPDHPQLFTPQDISSVGNPEPKAEILFDRGLPEKPRAVLNATVGMSETLVKYLEESVGFTRNSHPLLDDPNELRDVNAEIVWLANNRESLRMQEEFERQQQVLLQSRAIREQFLTALARLGMLVPDDVQRRSNLWFQPISEQTAITNSELSGWLRDPISDEAVQSPPAGQQPGITGQSLGDADNKNQANVEKKKDGPGDPLEFWFDGKRYRFDSTQAKLDSFLRVLWHGYSRDQAFEIVNIISAYQKLTGSKISVRTVGNYVGLTKNWLGMTGCQKTLEKVGNCVRWRPLE